MTSEEIKERLSYIIETYKNKDSDNIEDVNNILDRVILDFDTSDICPDIILTRALYIDEDTGNFQRGKFVIRPTVKYNLAIKDVKFSFTIINSPNFFKEFIEHIIDWVVDYTIYLELEKNLKQLNTCVFEILKDIDFPYMIYFSLGEGITDISDDSVTLGLDMETIFNIPRLGFFIEDEYWRLKYIKNFVNILKDCNRPYDIVKIKSDFTKELNIYSRKSINKLLRKFVSRKIDFVRVGVGYAENENSFALIERVAMTPEEVSNLDIDEIILMDNDKPTTIEKKKGLTKIVTRYKLTPFEKKTNVMLDIPLKEYIELV
jgi:hypothetical protein